ncbi:MAG: DUF973 family protein [Desulfurococcaceae archaeon]
MNTFPSSDRLVEAYGLMRTGILCMLVAAIMLIAGLMGLLVSFLWLVPPGRERVGVLPSIPSTVLFTAHFIAFILVLLVGAIIALIGLWGKLLPGMRVLKEVQPDFSTAETLVKLGYFWGLILLVVSIPLVSFSLIIGVFTGIIAAVLMLIGYIGLIILCFKLKELEREDLYLIAGVLLIIGIFFSIAVVIALILLYIALGNSIEKRRRGQVPAPTPPLLPPV